MPFFVFLIMMNCVRLEDGMSADRFRELMTAAQESVRDFELVCECRMYECAEKEVGAGGKRDLLKTYQASFAYRRDGAGSEEVYQRNHRNGEQFLKRKQASLKDRILYSNDQAGGSGRSHEFGKKGSAYSFAFEGSPARYLQIIQWDNRFRKDSMEGFHSEGEQDVAGRRCSVVSFARTSKSKHVFVDRYWIDFERGGNALRYEYTVSGHPWLSINNVKLERIATPGAGDVWFPVHAEVDTFAADWLMKGVKPAHFVEVYDLVKGSLVLNSGLTDDRFRIGSVGASVTGESIQEARSAFENTPVVPRPARKTDSKSVDADLQRKLQGLGAGGAPTEAEPPANREARSLVYWQIALALLGLAGIVAIVVLHRRSR